MELPGRVQNGVVVLEGDAKLPEGAAVIVSYQGPIPASPSVQQKRVQFPLVRSAHPGSLDLTGERIGEILDAEDASA